MPAEQSLVGLKVFIIADKVSEALASFPRVLNAEMNRSMGVGGGVFLRAFAPQLKGPGINMRRPGRSKKINRVSNPAVTRAAGFRGEVLGKRIIQGKLLSIRTRSPVMYAHEKGAVIRAKKPGFVGRLLGLGAGGLAIKVRTVEQAAKAGIAWPGQPFTFSRQAVRIKATLGCGRTWNAALPQGLDSVAKGPARAVNRVNKGFGVDNRP